MRILHVVESLGGGVATGLQSFIHHFPKGLHGVCAFRRPGHDIGDTVEADASRFFMMSPGPRRLQVREVNEAVKMFQPDVVHAHSSLAGLYVRLLMRRGAVRRVVYSPHGLAMRRTDVSVVTRQAFEVAERVQASRTDVFAGCSPAEVAVGERLGHRRSELLPYALADEERVMLSQFALSRRRNHLSRIRVGAVGRISAQKDPAFFLAVIRHLGAITRLDAFEFMWVGGGDPPQARALERSGVIVTGWLKRSEVLAHMANLDVYVHTAAWEGMPLTLLEASELKLPLVVRLTPSMEGLPLGRRSFGRSPVELAQLLAARVHEAGVVSDDGAALAAAYSPARQREALGRLYA